MIGASKILTVSYGTFSCTLEGFDEPFNTMKAIAEYFRDLAADDRYFGAEPPTPDAAMLHRIAEREVHRRVEAKIHDNGVTLRAGDSTAPMAPAPQPAPMPQPAPTGLLAEESVAAKLQRIRSAVSRAAVPASPVIADAIFVEDEDDAAPLLPATAAATAFVPTPVQAAPLPEPADDSPIADLRDKWDAIDEAEEAEEDAAYAAAEDDLREVFEEPDFTAIAEPDLPLAEDDLPSATEVPASAAEPPEAFAVEADDAAPDAYLDAAPAIADDLPEDIAVSVADEPPEAAMDEAEDASLIAALTATDRDEIVPEPQPEPEADADLSVLLSTLATEPAPETEDPTDTEIVFADEVAFAGEEIYDEVEPPPAIPSENEAVEDDATAEEEAFLETLEDDTPDARPTLPEWTDDTEEFDEAPFSETAAAPVFPDDPDYEEAFEDLPDAAAVAAAVAATPAPDDTSPAAEKLRRARARVIKVRRADAPTEPAAPLTPEAEADLERELAEVDKDTDADRKTERDGRNILENSKGDEDVSRLLRQTNTEMDVPENRRRLSTLAHLKAAVAATVAELRAPNPAAEAGETTSRLDRYRADLARVVRPRRPEGTPVTERPAPLVLVSEQRIDRPAPTDAVSPGRVMPRRISSGNLALEDDSDDSEDAAAAPDAENIFASSKNFAEFAERLGATELPDLLEAAAAYTACIEGRPHFSRPHLMRHLAAMTEDTDLSREDSMRSFGQLLRQGKIEKVRRGQFAITDSSYFLAEARRMTR